MRNPNLYPYNVFKRKYIEPFVFQPITILYGNNGSGKSTILNIIANCLGIEGKEYPTSNSFGNTDYISKYCSECVYDFADDEERGIVTRIPEGSRYIKSEDILYEVKKIEQSRVLSEGTVYDLMKEENFSKEDAKEFLSGKNGRTYLVNIKFAQEKYSNGEMSLQILEELILPDALYLLDEPEVSLSPQNQVKIAEELNKMARFLGCQFIIAIHSPFMLATLAAKIYNLDTDDFEEAKWTELENVRYFYEFFKKHKNDFE